MRQEFRLHGVDILLVEIGGANTPLINRAVQHVEQLVKESPPQLRQRYGAMLSISLEHMTRINQRSDLDRGKVAKVTGKVLTMRRPPTSTPLYAKQV